MDTAHSTHLAKLPMEMLEAVLLHLDFDDLCNLRLTAAEIAAKISQGSFRTRFTRKTMTASQDGFEDLTIVTQPNWLGCALEHLTIIGDISAAEYEGCDPRGAETAALLVKALKQLRTNTKAGRLRSIVLSVRDTVKSENGQHTRDWRRIWKCAGNTAALVATAVQASAIQIERLELYTSTPRCALGVRWLQMLFDKLEIPDLRCLSFAVSGNEDGKGGSDYPSLSQAIRHFLAQSPSLEQLDVRWFDMGSMSHSVEQLHERQFLAESTAPSMPSLNAVSLKGIYATSEELVCLLTMHQQLRHLCFEELHLEKGKFDAVFAQITEHLQLEDLYLNDLWESRLIGFVGATGPSHFPNSGPPTWIKRKGLKTREKIVYKLSTGRTKASAKANNWQRRRALLYGPPE